MDNIVDELLNIELLRMSEDLVGEFLITSWMVFNHPQGKFIIDPTFQVGTVLPWESIKTLREKSRSKSFEWTIEDGSFSVQGRNGCWNLVFRMMKPPCDLLTASLSTAETKMMKEHLFKEL